MSMSQLNAVLLGGKVLELIKSVLMEFDGSVNLQAVNAVFTGNFTGYTKNQAILLYGNLVSEIDKQPFVGNQLTKEELKHLEDIRYKLIFYIKGLDEEKMSTLQAQLAGQSRRGDLLLKENEKLKAAISDAYAEVSSIDESMSWEQIEKQRDSACDFLLEHVEEKNE